MSNTIEMIRKSDHIVIYSPIRTDQRLWYIAFDRSEYHVDFPYRIIQGIDPGKERICFNAHQIIGDIEVSYATHPCTVSVCTRVATSKGGYAKVLFTIRPQRHLLGYPGDPDYPHRFHYGEFVIFRRTPDTNEKADAYLCRFFDENHGGFCIQPIDLR